jgi:hypothetical protein
VIGLTETWLNEKNMDCFSLDDFEYLGSNRPKKKGGGVGFYVYKQLKFKSRNDLTKNLEDIIETKFIEITNNNGKSIIIGVIYRPPNSNFDQFQNTLNTILGKIDQENKLCYLMGDFNVDLFKSESCDYVNEFLEQLFTSSFLPLINKATRITSHTATLIDNIFTNNVEEVENSLNGIIFSDISDHLPIVHVSKTNVLGKNTHNRKNTNTVTYHRIFSKTNINTFENKIKDICWNEILNETDDPEKAYIQFLGVFLDIYEANFPIKQRENSKTINKHKSPWITNCILKSVRTKNRLYKTYLINPTDKNEQVYKNIKIN